MACANAEKRSCADANAPQPLPRWLIRERGGWKRMIQNFTPSWFSVTMGTGIVSILLHTLSTTYPSHSSTLSTLSIVLFIANVCLFSLILIVSILRYVLYPATWGLMIRHPVQSLFLGTAPMGFATIVNMFTLVCVPRWGGSSVGIAWAMWWIDVVASMACCFGLPFEMMTNHTNAHSTMTAAWLLPIVAPIVSASSGTLLASVLSLQHALWTLLTSYVLWGIGIPMAMIILSIYFHRLAVHKLPPQEVIVSVFLPLGPMGQGGYGILQLGKVAIEVFLKTETLAKSAMAGEILYVMGFAVAIILWGFGLAWLFFAIASISRSRFPFNMGWWGFTFPIGVFAMSTLTLGEELPSAFFRILGTILAVAVMLLWVVVSAGTVKNIFYGRIIEAPCLRELERRAALQSALVRDA